MSERVSNERAIEYLNSLAEEARWTRRLQSLPVSVATCDEDEETRAKAQRREEETCGDEHATAMDGGDVAGSGGGEWAGGAGDDAGGGCGRAAAGD